MTLSLYLYNPSPYWRSGFVTTPWQPVARETGIPAEEVVILDGARRPLPTQVHKVDPADPSRDVLVFQLQEEIAPGFDDYSAATAVVTVGERGGVDGGAPGGGLDCRVQSDEMHEVPYLWLDNGELALKFELAAAPWEERGGFYAGSATAVLLKTTEPAPTPTTGPGPTKYREVLDAFKDEIVGHDMEKRCMQVDRVDLSLPAWSREPSLRVGLTSEPYELVSCSAGPVRASACVASRPFQYRYSDPLSREERSLTCRLYRVLSLYRGDGFVVDELSVRGTHDGHEGGGAVRLHFTARYFMYMDFGSGFNLLSRTESSPLRHFRIDDWFGLRCDDAPFQGYGFATSAHAGRVENPHPGFPDPDNAHKSFSFSLGRAREATCLHLFARGADEPIEHRAGLAWYERAFRPLAAKPHHAGRPPQPTPRYSI